jgi:hypothetical protein
LSSNAFRQLLGLLYTPVFTSALQKNPVMSARARTFLVKVLLVYDSFNHAEPEIFILGPAKSDIDKVCGRRVPPVHIFCYLRDP